MELIVCDNNSTDRTAGIASAAGATVVLEPLNQIARARNTGAAEATGDWLFFVDADSHPTRELFGDAAEQILSGRVLAGGATIRMAMLSCEPARSSSNQILVLGDGSDAVPVREAGSRADAPPSATWVLEQQA